jgi:surfeit locus 1 family protein
MTAAKSGPGVVVTTLTMLVCLAILIGLGVWQLERKVWKENLIAAMTQRLDATPRPLPPPEQWQAMRQDTDEFRRVAFSAAFNPAQEALVFTPGAALRSDVHGPGYFIFAPARLTDGSVVVVNRGFIPQDRKDVAARAAGVPNGAVDIVGVLRWPEQPNMFTPHADEKGNVWFARDTAAMSEQGHWGRTAPFYVEQESPVPPGGWPKPGKLVVRLPDNHLQYALTWFGIAAALLGVYGWWMYGRFKRA